MSGATESPPCATDPTAADFVVRSGAAIRLVSLDGTNQVPLTAGFAERVAGLRDRAPGIGVLGELLSKNEYMRSGSYYLWDPLAAVLAAGYEVGTFSPAALSIDTDEGPTSGATRAGAGEPNAAYLTKVDATAAEDVLLGVLAGAGSFRLNACPSPSPVSVSLGSTHAPERCSCSAPDDLRDATAQRRRPIVMQG